MKTERQWKKSKLSVHYEHMKLNLQQQNSSRLALLFKTTKQLVNPGTPGVPITSNADCEMFLTLFMDKIEDI